jgi:hypothetical protein
LLWVSYPLAAAVVAVVAYRVFNLWLTVIPAGAGLSRLRRRWGPRRAMKPRVRSDVPLTSPLGPPLEGPRRPRS